MDVAGNRAASPRDPELEKAITQAAAGAASQVIPFSFDPERDKAGRSRPHHHFHVL